MNRSLGKWTLPQPTDMKEEEEWVAIPKIARTVPFGYVVDENDPDVLQPVKLELDLLEQARAYTRQYSYRQVANWLTKETGRYISHTGLRKRIEVDKRRKRTITIKRKFARRLEKAINEIKKLEEDSLDCFTLKDNARA